MSGNVDLKQLGNHLHQRLIDGDVTVTAEIAETFIEPITRSLRKKFPQLDNPHLINEAVEDAILNYFDQPPKYNPTKRSLKGYLYMSARGDLLNLLERYKREIASLRSTEIVEDPDRNAEYEVEIQDPSNLEASVLTNLSPLWKQLLNILPDPVDQEIALLMMENERKTSIYADVLGILDLPIDEQTRIVKRHKDRLKKKLRRNIKLSELKEDE